MENAAADANYGNGVFEIAERHLGKRYTRLEDRLQRDTVWVSWVTIDIMECTAGYTLRLPRDAIKFAFSMFAESILIVPLFIPRGTLLRDHPKDIKLLFVIISQDNFIL